jgi:hypothetical protein
MKILFYLAVWKRPGVTEVCFMGLKRLMEYTKGETLAVISEESMIPLCEKYGIMWVMHENLPIGKKKNFGLKQALRLEWDYVIELGSDDLIKNELIDLYRPYFGKENFLTVGSIAFINSKTLACRVIEKNSAFGLGRCLSRSVVETHEVYHNGLSKSLDKNVLFGLTSKGVQVKILPSERILTMDIKTDVNIWGYQSAIGTKRSFNQVVEGLPSEEVEAIKSLNCVTV